MERVPDKVAYVEADGTEWTYRRTRDRSLQAAGGLQELGVGVQEPVAMMLDNSYDFLSVLYGLGLTRRVQVPVNTAYKGTFLAHVLRDSGARVLVVEDHYVDRLATIQDDVPDLATVVVRGGDGAALARSRFRVVSFEDMLNCEAAPLAEADPADLMAIMYTSGTTGLSKGVEITQVHAYTYASREDAERPRADDRILVMLPMFHLAGQWYGCYQSLIAQATAVIQPAFSVSRFWGWVRDFRITETIMLGAVAELLQQAEPRPDDADNPLTLAVMAPLASDMEGFRARFGVELGAVYGMSEIGSVMFSDPADVVPGEAGRARDGYRLRLVDEAGRDVADGVAGELLVRPDSPLQVMRGYHGLPDKTAETLVDGWVHTGDIFRRDAEGHYYFVDRRKDALRRRGENISSFEVERALNEFPDVYESAVVAVPAELGEDEIKAVVVPREGREVDPAALIRFVAERMPYFMVPRYVEVVAELPKTPTQKIQKHMLRRPVDTAVWDREAAGIHVSRRS
ncbi:AMP-binding protein [Nocardioides campestrisoli]|uniref:AMP-binding protein n=1 Tax=Nocardioides campestrisoli TaxID=2736757 RepID=UPI001CD1BCC5|nr:AMP-binding protein [Nocardioides campestrisoli]